MGRVPVPEAPQTIRQNWIPFLTFFFRRIIFYCEQRMKVSKRWCNAADGGIELPAVAHDGGCRANSFCERTTAAARGRRGTGLDVRRGTTCLLGEALVTEKTMGRGRNQLQRAVSAAESGRTRGCVLVRACVRSRSGSLAVEKEEMWR